MKMYFCSLLNENVPLIVMEEMKRIGLRKMTNKNQKFVMHFLFVLIYYLFLAMSYQNIKKSLVRSLNCFIFNRSSSTGYVQWNLVNLDTFPKIFPV